MNEHEKELKRKYGTTDIRKILKKIDARALRTPYALKEIGLRDNEGVPALSHIEDAGFYPEDTVDD